MEVRGPVSPDPWNESAAAIVEDIVPRNRTTSSDQRLFTVASVSVAQATDEARKPGPARVRSALAATASSPPGKPSISQRYSRAQTERARRGIALARQELAAA